MEKEKWQELDWEELNKVPEVEWKALNKFPKKGQRCKVLFIREMIFDDFIENGKADTKWKEIEGGEHRILGWLPIENKKNSK